MEPFDPSKLIEDSIERNFDPAAIEDMDEREIDGCKNVASWILDPEFLDAKTIYPAQLQVLLKLCGDVCPWCSDWEFYQKDFSPTEKIGNILDRLQLLDDGKCPKCKQTRLDQYLDKKWMAPHEMVLCWGMRCIPKSSWVFSEKGLVRFSDVNVGDWLTHGAATEKIDSGVLPSLVMTTEYNWRLTGARDSHIVPILNARLEIEHKKMKDCQVGELLVLQSPKLWPKKQDFKITLEPARQTGSRLNQEPTSIPSYILQAPREIVHGFLIGLLGEGFLEKPLHFTTTSKDLMEQTRLLLLNFGVVTDLQSDVASYTLSSIDLEYVTPNKTYSRMAYETWPRQLQDLTEKGYFFVKIKTIEAGPDLDMMDIHVPGSNMYTADGFVHHNSGKSAEVGLLATYLLHRFLRIPDPASYFSLFKGSLLTMRFIALTQGQAAATVWHEFIRAKNSCAWFNKYHDFLDHHGKRKGVELHTWMTTYFTYHHKSITGYYLGASIDSSRGRTGIASFIDEIGWWQGGEQAKRANAHETYLAHEKACRTIRNNSMQLFLAGDYNVPTAILGSVSSTMAKTDYIMRLIKLGKKDPKKIASHKASWEVNPVFTTNPEELENERLSNPKAFDRDYGSVPPFADSPFIENEAFVKESAKLEKPFWGVRQKENNVGFYLDAENIPKDKSIPYCLAIDLAFNNCGYAAALLKLCEHDFSVVEVAGLFSVYPPERRVIDMDETFKSFVLPMCENLNIRTVLYDQWQSRSQIQALEKIDGIEAFQYSLTYNDFVKFRSSFLQSKLVLVAPEMALADVDTSPDSLEEILYPRPYLHLLWQLLSVSEYGTKITKGSGHDDIFRALVLGCNHLWNEENRKYFEYKGNSPLFRKRKSDKKLVMMGSSRSGQNYGGQSSGGQVSTYVGSKHRRVLGGILVRNKK